MKRITIETVGRVDVRRLAITLCVLLLAIAACGDEGGTADTTELAGDAGTATTANGSSADTGVEAEATDPESSDDGAANRGLPPGGTGTVTIDGETIESEWVGNCEIDETFDPRPGDLDLTASLGGGLQAFFLEISNQELMMGGDEPYTYLQFRPGLQIRDDSGSIVNYEALYVTGPEGEWYEDADGALAFMFAQGGEPETDPLAGPPLILEEGRATGSFALDGAGTPIEVSYDLTFVDPVDCSL
jgi:hypothetical protein